MYGKFSTKTKYKEFKENHETYYHQNDKKKGIELSSFIFIFFERLGSVSVGPKPIISSLNISWNCKVHEIKRCLG